MVPRTRLCMLAVLLIPASAFAQATKAPFSLRLEPISTSPRSYAPILVEATLDPHTDRLFEGTLHLRFSEGSVKLLEMRIPDIVVSSVPYTTTLVLPPMPAPNNKVIDVNAKFVTADSEFLLGAPGEQANESYLSLLVTPSSQRALTVGMVIASKTTPETKNLTFLSKALAFDTYAEQPKAWTRGSDGKMVLASIKFGWFACSSAILESRRLPADPIALCAFNIVVLADGGFRELDPKQYKGLIAWVRAGGSLCVVPDGALTPRHTSFLTDLLVEHPNPPAMTRDESGGLVDPTGSLRVMSRLGLGRVVLLSPTASLADTLQQPDCRQIAAFLWKIRRQKAGKTHWASATPPKINLPEEGDSASPWAQGYILQQSQAEMQATTARPVSMDAVTSQLMPSNVRMVPLGLVAAMLCAYVFVVGPGDYLLLGMFKMRRYTWVVFPIVTTLFTIAMVTVSNHYMGTTENGGQIEIADVVGSGQVVRRTEIDLEFFGGTREVSEDYSAVLTTPMDLRVSMRNYQLQLRNQMQFDEFGQQIAPTFRQSAEFSGDSMELYYEGRVPSRYKARRIVRQWEPQLHRRFEITNELAPNFGFDWGNPGEFWTSEGRAKLRRAIRSHDDTVGALLLNYSGNGFVINGMTNPDPRKRQRDYTRPYRGWSADGSEDFALLRQLSSRSTDFFRYTSAISPNGGNNFEDLVMVDSSDPWQWLLILSKYDGDTQRVYRKLYYRPQPTPAEDWMNGPVTEGVDVKPNKDPE